MKLLGPATFAAMLFALAFASVPLLAQTISFEDLPGNNTDPFFAYQEDGYSVSATSGTWQVAKAFGNPTPDIFCNCATGEISIEQDAGEPFYFAAVDLAYSEASYVLSGSYLGELVWSQTGTTPSGFAFETVLATEPTALIDQLRITMSPGNGPGFNVDNISVRPVPSPTAFALLAMSLVGIVSRRAYRG